MSKTVSTEVIINNKLGLHARPAMVFVEVASKYQADVAVKRCDQSEVVNGKSIMQMMMLAATKGTRICITASGSDADDAIKGLAELVDSNFQEE